MAVDSQRHDGRRDPVPDQLGRHPHPATSAPAGLILESFRIEHPEPHAIVGRLQALGAQVDVRPASEMAFVARINGPFGAEELR